MKNLDHIWAKSEPRESLTEHTDHILRVWKDLLDQLPSWANEPEFRKRSFLSLLFHDFGKVAQNFQEVIQGKRKTYAEFIRHEFLSGMLLWLTEPTYYIKKRTSLFAVFTHHKPLHDHLFQQDALRTLKLEEGDLRDLMQYAQRRASESNVDLNIPEAVYLATKGDKALGVLYDYFYNAYSQMSDWADRSEYIRYKAVLQICDWSASGHEDIPKGTSLSVSELGRTLKKQLVRKGKITPQEPFKFRKFQVESELDDDVVAIAPTGSGKTEAALIWASQKQAQEKLLYLLPTRVTSNAIFQRLTEIFGESNCALIHSSAFLLRKEQEDERGNKDYSRFKDYLKERTFFRNINVCTVDQLLTQGFNLGYWEIKTFHCQNARIIIDEIHLYQPWTLGLIISTLKYLKKEWRAKFYIMTATMPENLLGLLKKTLALDNASLIRDSELLNDARNTFEIRNCQVDQLQEEISLSLNKGKKVLLVVNTVDEAIRLYEQYSAKFKKVICYHSRFIQKDRQAKEVEIFEAESSSDSVLLIATQVVEVSLDIDFDILFTENAPIDALVQRAGRVNRKRKKDGTKVIVCQPSRIDIVEKWIYTLPGILDRTWNVLADNNGRRLTEAELTTFVDQIYEGTDIEQNESYQAGLKIYEKLWREHLAYIKDNLNPQEAYTREGMNSVNVIPAKYFDTLADSDNLIEKSKHEVSVRSYRAIGTTSDSQGFRYLECDYNDETGLKFLKKESDESGSSLAFI